MTERLVKPTGTDFFQDAIDAYGREGAQQICETLKVSLDPDYHQIPLLSPLAGMQLMVHSYDSTEVSPVSGFARSHEGIIKLALDANASIEQILADIPSVATHEVTHVAHYQHNPAVFRQATLWSYTIREGVATHAELSDTEEYFPGQIYNYEPPVLTSIDDTLIDVLYDPGNNQPDRHYEYLRGDDTFPNRGYEVGLFLVAKMVLQHGDDLAGLLRLSLDEWREFAENEL